jgi:hypothetical protein
MIIAVVHSNGSMVHDDGSVVHDNIGVLVHNYGNMVHLALNGAGHDDGSCGAW